MKFYVVEEFYTDLSNNLFTLGEDSYEHFISLLESDPHVVGFTFSLFDYNGSHFTFVSRETFGTVPEQQQEEEPF